MGNPQKSKQKSVKRKLQDYCCFRPLFYPYSATLQQIATGAQFNRQESINMEQNRFDISVFWFVGVLRVA
jgi:hypothetical protein